MLEKSQRWGGQASANDHSKIKAPPPVRCMWLKGLEDFRFFGKGLPPIQPNYSLKSMQKCMAPYDFAALALLASNPGGVTFLGDNSDFPRNVFRAIAIQNARRNLTAPLKSFRLSESQFCIRRIRASDGRLTAPQVHRV